MKLLSFTLLLLVTTFSQAVEETVNVGHVKCGKVNFRCSMKVTFGSDCSTVSRVVPRCTPKKSKCTKGVPVTIVTKRGCKVSGIFKSNGRKQSVTEILILPSTEAPPSTTPTTSPYLVETVNHGQVKCKKMTYQECKMTVTYIENCSRISKVVPNCTPKKTKCTKGVSVSFDTQKGCTVTGMYKNNGKKQTMSKLTIEEAIPTSTTPTPGCSEGVVRWSGWKDWSECNSTSPFAMKFRLRHCMNSPTASACEGHPIEIASCTPESQNNTNPG